jgi:hypothetical protein
MAGERTGDMQQFQGFEQRRQALDTADAEAGEHGIRHGIAAGKRGRVRHRRTFCLIRSADLQNHHRLPRPPGHSGKAFEGSEVPEPFDMKADRRDTRVVDQCTGDIGKRCLRLVACGDHIGDRQPPGLHGQVDGDIGGLREDRHTSLDALHAVLIGPEQRAVETVDQPVAVRPEYRHIAGCRKQGLLQLGAII